MLNAMSDDVELKREFARQLVKLGSPDVAARSMWPNEPQRSMLVAMAWPSDTVVKEAIAEFEAKTDLKKLIPSKEDLLRELWHIGTGERPTDTKDRIAALAKFADVAGFIDKGTAVKVNVGLTNKVMVVPAEQSLEDWERETMAQQEQLIAEANNVVNTKH